MGTPDLVVLGRGDPRSRATWSGTPLALTRAFESLGLDVLTLDGSEDSRPLKAASRLAAVARGHTGAAGFACHYWPRYPRGAARVAALRRSLPDAVFVHTDTMWLPYDGMGRRDVLYRDATWQRHAEAFGVGPRPRAHIEDLHAAAISRVGHVFTCSEWAASEFRALYGVDAVAVGTGTGITPDEVVPHGDYASGRTLFVAKVRFEQKGGPLLLEAFALARKEDPALTLTMVLAPEMEVSQDGVTVLNQLSWADLKATFAGAGLYAMPATYEPWGLVYVEAMQLATPVLGLARAAVPELTGHGAHGFIADASPSAVAAALLEAHASPSRLAEMGAAAQAFASRYTWQRTAQQIWDAVRA